MEKENIKGKDPITIEGKDPITIDCTSIIYNPKGGAIPKLGTKEFNDSAMEMFGGKPKQQTAMQELIDFIESQEYNFLNKEQLESCNKIKEKAEQLLEMEKQEQENFASWCIKKRVDFFDDTEIGETYTIDGFVSRYKMKELLEMYRNTTQCVV